MLDDADKASNVISLIVQAILSLMSVELIFEGITVNTIRKSLRYSY